MQRVIFTIGQKVIHNGLEAIILDTYVSGNPCRCCAGLKHNSSLLATIQYTSSGTKIEAVDFSALTPINQY